MKESLNNEDVKMIFITLVDLLWMPLLLLVFIVIAIEQIKNSDFFKPQPYSKEDIAITRKYGKVIGKLYHWFI